MTTTPIVALQKAKEISLNEIEAELSQVWHFQNGDKDEAGAVRAATFSMVVYEPEEFQQLLAILGFYKGAIDGIYGDMTKTAVYEAQKLYGLRLTSRVDTETLARLREEVSKLSPEQKKISNPNMRGHGVSDAIAVQNPCRIISLCPVLGDEEGVTTQVSVSCPLPLQKTSASLICCEYVTLRGSKPALNHIGDVVASLLIADLPKFVWWKATPNPEQALFKQMVEACNGIILDSSYFSDPESEFLKIYEMVETKTSVVDLNWHRISAWQELTAEAYDPPERRVSLGEVDQVAIDYEKGNAAQALMYLGWLASRLGWEPVSYTEAGGDYDLRHVQFTANGKTIEAELAAIPTADSGEIIGDLIGLRLTSTNPQADCCTILCSETTGCMRMEAGGTAQSCRTELVTAINDQRAELLLSQQLQRWGQDVLYEESLAVVNHILQIRDRSRV
jgi:glucose-6-phosphate dehydrogenase assembly protein OpcA